jgi:NADP-dependent 3-hydroxy acid dehydrogenase YdfG
MDSIRPEVTKYGIRILDVYLGAMNTQMTNGRPNQELLMDPKEVAKVIVGNCGLHESLSVNELTIRRTKYG